MFEDLELKAMNEISNSIKNLNDDEKNRVIDWIIDRFAIKTKPTLVEPSTTVFSKSQESSVNIEINSFDTVSDILADISPKTMMDRILIVSAYLQNKLNKESLTSQEVNQELKCVGYPASNITVFMKNLIKKKPCLLMQVSQQGKGLGSLKKYRVTTAGFEAVKKMLNSVS
jgi:hypothetical protein